MNYPDYGAAPQAPSSGFKNIKPLTRKERRALKDKVALEKQRLMNRTGLAAKMYRENAPENPSDLLTLQSNAAGFLADADRYHSDTAGEEFQIRKKAYDRKQEIYNNTRIKRAENEEQRWKKIEDSKVQEERYWETQRELGVKSAKNKSCVPYDPLTLQYHDTHDGEKLRYADDMVRYRAKVRAQNMRRQGDTRSGYNIINGIAHTNDPLPGAPEKSDYLKHYEGGGSSKR
mmetsp:Transcript_2966/g.5676  ORF Transcript_2966/g.5676 Transcript_2966/m.5676 type:complete len:231 (-) Transcript_2966:64-756(-)|eukprot:CAMPEP_0182465762 /NCGR_PEP_ID=MMETSP1319-20130603/10633_1 /TAXON_ID=172717 /ORGANISM="Bolidomonas pacifica, Strain RCC208" /LENGTH=230 /DNA_ID=CAMNT_0024665607 /DNA_START=154 /DNA_END=846 /DNA_ORIENTATION=+